MNDPEHHAIVRLAFATLARQGNPGLTALAGEVDGTCMLPDQYAIGLLRGENGPWRRYFPVRLPPFNFEQSQRDVRALMPANRFYLRETVEAWRIGDLVEGARFLGVYSHYLGDFSQPAHYYELDIGRLLPPPPRLRHCNYHRMIEDIPATVTDLRYRPRLLGTSVEEIEFRVAGELAALYRRAVAAVIPMVRAIYRNRPSVATRALNPVLAATARLFADIATSCWQVAHGTAAPAAVARLHRAELRLIPPDAYDAEFNFSHEPLIDSACIRQYGPATPFALIPPAGGPARQVPGICAVPHALPMAGIDLASWLEWRLPEGVFASFAAEVGLLAGHAPQARCRFAVELDDEVVWESDERGAADPAFALCLPLDGATRLRLTAITDGSTDKLAFPIWANPTLRKA